MSNRKSELLKKTSLILKTSSKIVNPEELNINKEILASPTPTITMSQDKYKHLLPSYNHRYYRKDLLCYHKDLLVVQTTKRIDPSISQNSIIAIKKEDSSNTNQKSITSIKVRMSDQ